MVLETIREALSGRSGDDLSIGLTPDEILHILADPRRRAVIRFAAEELSVGETAPLDDVAIYIAAVENDTDPSAVTFDQEQDVRTELLHSTLPKLTRARVVTCDQQSRRVGRGDDVEDLAQLADEVERASSALGPLREPHPHGSSNANGSEMMLA